ncbi:MAG: hypothetical protein PHE27_03550 [Alphaproteobacteria bacterium]|nr:hypothetical protein [Alphaproteobacteria bacterium]
MGLMDKSMKRALSKKGALFLQEELAREAEAAQAGKTGTYSYRHLSFCLSSERPYWHVNASFEDPIPIDALAGKPFKKAIEEVGSCLIEQEMIDEGKPRSSLHSPGPSVHPGYEVLFESDDGVQKQKIRFYFAASADDILTRKQAEQLAQTDEKTKELVDGLPGATHFVRPAKRVGRYNMSENRVTYTLVPGKELLELEDWSVVVHRQTGAFLRAPKELTPSPV